MTDIAERGTLPEGPQVRSYPAQFEVRAVAGAPAKVELRGYASVFDQPYDMFDVYGPYTEVARTGMFTTTLAAGPDVAYLANHAGITMARTTTGSLNLTQDSTGLLAVARVNTTRGDVRTLVSAIEDGDVDQMSFAFRVMRQQWSPDYDQRDLLEVDINRGDVSAVNFGASPATTVVVQRAFSAYSADELRRMAADFRRGGKPAEDAAQRFADVLDTVAMDVGMSEPTMGPLTALEDYRLGDSVLGWLKLQMEADER